MTLHLVRGIHQTDAALINTDVDLDLAHCCRCNTTLSTLPVCSSRLAFASSHRCAVGRAVWRDLTQPVQARRQRQQDSQDSLSLLNNSHHQNHHQWHHNTSHPPKTEWVIRRTWNWDSTASQSGMLLPRCTHTDEWTPKTQCTQPRLLDGSHKNWNLLLVLTTLI